jgi:hypothetical protein
LRENAMDGNTQYVANSLTQLGTCIANNSHVQQYEYVSVTPRLTTPPLLAESALVLTMRIAHVCFHGLAPTHRFLQCLRTNLEALERPTNPSTWKTRRAGEPLSLRSQSLAEVRSGGCAGGASRARPFTTTRREPGCAEHEHDDARGDRTPTPLVVSAVEQASSPDCGPRVLILRPDADCCVLCAPHNNRTPLTLYTVGTIVHLPSHNNNNPPKNHGPVPYRTSMQKAPLLLFRLLFGKFLTCVGVCRAAGLVSMRVERETTAVIVISVIRAVQTSSTDV